MISGTIRYRQSDAALAQATLDQAQPMPLWKGTLVTAGLGAALGGSLTEIAKPLLAPLVDAGAAMPWAALFGAIVAQQDLDEHSVLLDFSRRLFAQVGQRAINPLARLLAGALRMVEQLSVRLPRLAIGKTIPSQVDGVGGFAGLKVKVGQQFAKIIGLRLAVLESLPAALAPCDRLEDAAALAKGPGSFHVELYDALAALDPDTLDGRIR